MRSSLCVQSLLLYFLLTALAYTGSEHDWSHLFYHLNSHPALHLLGCLFLVGRGGGQWVDENSRYPSQCSDFQKLLFPEVRSCHGRVVTILLNSPHFLCMMGIHRWMFGKVMFLPNSWGILSHHVKVQGKEKMWHSNSKKDLYTVLWGDNATLSNIILSTLQKKKKKKPETITLGFYMILHIFRLVKINLSYVSFILSSDIWIIIF